MDLVAEGVNGGAGINSVLTATDNYSDDALNIIRSAQEYQSKASDPRLGNKPRTSSSLAAGGDSRGINNIQFNSNYKANSIGTKGHIIKQQRKQKRDEANLVLSNNGIKIAATL